MTTTTFDPAAYTNTTRTQPDQAAAWHAWGPTLEDWLGEATTLMLDAAGIHTGSAVVDVAAGAGGQSLTAARRAGPAGRVLATDISPALRTPRRPTRRRRLIHTRTGNGFSSERPDDFRGPLRAPPRMGTNRSVGTEPDA